MIRITAIANSAAAKAYFRSADYYLEGQELTAHWHGKGAERLGLSGAVDYRDFEKLCDNLIPGSGKQLTAKTAINRRVGYDFTWSVPKSVSVAYALGQDDRLPDAFRGAVADTMAEMEREMETRVRKRGANENRRTGNMIWCDFLHQTSRPIKGQPDPQLHVHAVVFNATFDTVEGEWKAGEFAHLKANAPYFQAVFRSRLATRLQDLGYDVQRKRDDFEIVGIPDRTVKEFSRRTTQIEKLADLLGIKNPDSKAKLGATSREKKTKGLTWDDLLGLWTDRLKPGELDAIRSTVAKADAPLAQEDRAPESVDYALRHLLERKSVVDQRSVMTEALKFGLGSVTPESVAEEIGRRRDLIRRQVDGRTLVSTKGVLSEEKRITDWAVKGRGRCRPLVSATPSRHPASGFPDLATLSVSQQAAVCHVWNSPDRLIIVRGAAGTGKTTLTRTALAGVDVPWVILAPSAEASRGVLRRDGFAEADTLAAFLNSEEMQQKVKHGLIWLDEASLTGAHDMARLVQLADQLKARIVLSGDRRQHKSVSRGDILAMLEDKAGCPAAEVGEIRRQSGEYREAVKMLAAGSVGAAFEKLDGMGWIKEAMPVGESLEPGANPADQSSDLNRMIAADYLKAINDDRSVLVVCPTHAEGKEITTELRNALREAGKIGRVDHEFDALVNLNLTAAELEEAKKDRPEGVVVARYGAYRPEKISLAVGDSIRVTANVKDVTGKHRINNGGVYGIAGFTDAGDIRLDNGWVLGKGVSHITHGYVVTSHAAQGKTVDHVLVAMPASTFPAVGREAAYVSVSRGRYGATIFTDDRDALRDAWCREEHRLLASDLVREPKKGIRSRIKKHISFLRSIANRGIDKALGREPERELIYGRE